MNYGLYLSASGVMSNLYRQDVYANNLANVRTVGFKPDMPTIQQRDPESREGSHSFDLSNELLDRLGGGVMAGRQGINMQPGSLRDTGNPLDVALVGRNAFLTVQATDPTTGNQSVQLTRDGRMTLNDQGTLVMAGNGSPVLSEQGQPITLPPGAEAMIDGRGNVLVNGEPIARLGVTGINDTERLIKQGNGLYHVGGRGEWRATPDDGSVKAGYLEDSAVDPITAMMDVIKATKAVTSNGRLLQYHDLINDRAVNQLGRVSG